MPREAKKAPLSRAELLETGLERRNNSKLYERESSGAISEIVSCVASSLTTEKNHVSLNDTPRIKNILQDYLQACIDTATVPSVAGFCRALGISRTAFYSCLNSKSPVETSELFQCVHDSFADILLQCSLRGAIQPVVSIFVAKALFGLRDSSELVIEQKTPNNPLGPEVDLKRLEDLVENIVIDD